MGIESHSLPSTFPLIVLVVRNVNVGGGEIADTENESESVVAQNVRKDTGGIWVSPQIDIA